ncbi:MAG: hypothetical protein AAGD25_39185 [Cyanobacteria bacterium P01_F01_bin.150]
MSCKPAPPPEPELPAVTLKPIEAPPALNSIHCAIASDSPSLALMHVANDLGYFEVEGLEFQITEVPPSTAPRQSSLLSLLQDDVDCIAQTLDSYLRTLDGQLFQTAVIASLYTSTGAEGLVVAAPVSSIEDLFDQSIGGDRHHPGMLLTYSKLRELGYGIDDFIIKPIDWPEKGAEEQGREGARAQGRRGAEVIADGQEGNGADQPGLGGEDSVGEAIAGLGPDSGDATEDIEEEDRAAVRPSYGDIFRKEGVVAIAASEPRLSHIAQDTGGQILITSGESDSLLMGTLVVERSKLDQDRDRYRGLLKGIYRASELYDSDRPQFLEIAAPYYGVPTQVLDQKLQTIAYTSYPDLQRIIDVGARTGTLFRTFINLDAIHQDLDLQNGPLFYDDHVDHQLILDLLDQQPLNPGE